MRPSRSQNLAALPFVLPFVAVNAGLFLYPTAQMLWMSLTDGQLIRQGEFIGLDNYARLLRDWRFGRALSNTAWFIVFTVIPATVVGLILALMVDRARGLAKAALMAVFFLPYLLPVTTVVEIWEFMIGAAIRAHAAATGIRPLPIQTWPGAILPLAAVLTIWWTAGFNTLLFVAGLKAIPAEIYEAAELDGAGRRARLFRLTLPMLWPVTALVLVLQFLMQIKVFDQIYLLASGGRVDSTMVLVQYIYTLAFQRNSGGYAAAVAVTFFLIVGAIALLQLRLRRAAT